MQAEVDRMVQKAEKLCAENEANRPRLTPERFKKLLFHFAHTLNKEKPRDKLEDGGKEKIKAAVQETLDWLEENQLAAGHRLLMLVVSSTLRGALHGLLVIP